MGFSPDGESLCSFFMLNFSGEIGNLFSVRAVNYFYSRLLLEFVFFYAIIIKAIGMGVFT
jgi:hypothetical protein